MAVGTWAVFNKAKKKIANGTIVLGNPMRMVLLKTYPALTVSLLGSLSQVTSGNGYSSSGKTLAGESWTVSAGATQTYRLDATDPIWTATGGSITSIKAAAIVLSAASAGGMHCVCVVSLSSSAFTLGSGSTLTVQNNSAGIFRLY